MALKEDTGGVYISKIQMSDSNDERHLLLQVVGQLGSGHLLLRVGSGSWVVEQSASGR